MLQLANKHVETINQEDTIMNSNDSISRAALLSVLESREMTRGEMIDLVRGAAPLEVDTVHNPNVSPTPPIEWCPGYLITGLPDYMG